MKRHLVCFSGICLSLALLLGLLTFTPSHSFAATTNQAVRNNLVNLSTQAWKGSATFAASAPAHTTSHYESSTSAATLQSQGCSAAKGAAGVVVLDFGEPDYSGGAYGTYDFGGHFDSDTAIFHAVANFVLGAWNCRVSSTNLAVAIGTSNYAGGISSTSSTWYTAGQDWGNLVNNEQSYISSNGYNNVIGAYGADDLETEWASYTLSSNFVKGYNNKTSRVFFDYGDDTPGYWTSYDVWYVSYGAAADVPLPEIYYNADATSDWEQLSIWACNNEGGPIHFRGVMTEYPTGNSPATGWDDMYNAEGASSCTAAARSSLIFSTNI